MLTILFRFPSSGPVLPAILPEQGWVEPGRGILFVEPARGRRFYERGRGNTFRVYRGGAVVPRQEIIRPGEDRDYYLEYENLPEIVAGGTLTGTPTITFNTAGLTVGAPAISGTQVIVNVIVPLGATEGEYLFYGLCPATGGLVLRANGSLLVSAWGG